MFKNYLKLAYRNIIRHKGYAAINILGLSIGIAACLLILQYVAYELSYEDMIENRESIYRVNQDRYDNGKLSTQWASGAFAVGNSFKEAFPEIQAYVKIVPEENSLVITNSDNPIKIELPYFVSEDFFNVFSYPLLKGNKTTVLKEPFTAALSATLAQKIFGNKNPIGESIQVNKNHQYKVTGVFEDFPANSHMGSDLLLSYQSFLQIQAAYENNPETAWLWDGCITYLQLKPGTNAALLEKKFPGVVDAAVGKELKSFNASVTYLLQPISQIHLNSNRIGEARPTGNSKTVYLLLGISLFIIVIAWINYINLATARSINRAKEVGIRKVVGSNRADLIQQFLLESALMNALSIGIAFLLILLFLPVFNYSTNQQLSFSELNFPVFWIVLGFLFVAGSLLSGIYPALVLSGFKPIKVLKGKMSGSSQGILLRKGLVVFQFSASLFLLIGTVIVQKQISFMKSQEIGLNIEQTLVLKRPMVVRDSIYAIAQSSFKQELSKLPAVRGIAVSNSIPGEPVNQNAGGIRLITEPESKQNQYRIISMDYDYPTLYGLQLIAGNSFSQERGSSGKPVLFNQTGIKQLGFNNPKDAIGKQIFFWGDTMRIDGVVADFHQQSLQSNFEPLILVLRPDTRGYMSIRLQTQDLKSTLSAIEQKWKSYFPGNQLEYFFLDAHFDAQYKADNQFALIFSIFTFLAIFVACMGLFGLASYLTIQRTKEIGIRKVLGASVQQIIFLFYKELGLMVALSFVLAVPLAFIAGKKWLQSFAFQTSLSWFVFVIPFVLIVLIGLITISYQTIKASLRNPALSLRTE
ncbi:ABC transporter permease [Flavihumibacter sp. CACIAM 22H1]|uniref:ABC transporter permease n=1 Tax=Flavihumibacter sp. CACIAM 22H1 TaxID=1812911 RepID=UPI0007A83AAC|nr:ABC transporter permease [Flavihumibacter sp. CACIAM 22H1]KYP14488.1 MAG: ABC transporter permease [Flavihumibacter sp. CACIAM 22H1]